ncbi:MAG: helix-turn-helix transcriptional regulator [Oscillospiraceae bacterium]|nr:helix-turn-helix transcriptional regulator [Oscillospiraceae bacterium]
MIENVLSDLAITKIQAAHTIRVSVNQVKHDVRPNWLIVYMFEGELIYNANGSVYTASPETVIILPNGCEYDWYCSVSGRYIAVRFDCELCFREILSIPVIDSQKLLDLFKLIEYKRNRQAPMHKIENMRDTYSLLLLLEKWSRRKDVAGSKQLQLKPAVEYIAQNLNKDIQNDDLAALTGLSTSHFRKRFCEVYGLSPIAYTHNLRIKRAKEMLQGDYGSIRDIALSLGYNNIYEFSKAFKKHTGLSPTQYAKQYH